jgi:hypothetical protein
MMAKEPIELLFNSLFAHAQAQKQRQWVKAAQVLKPQAMPVTEASAGKAEPSSPVSMESMLDFRSTMLDAT